MAELLQFQIGTKKSPASKRRVAEMTRQRVIAFHKDERAAEEQRRIEHAYFAFRQQVEWEFKRLDSILPKHTSRLYMELLISNLQNDYKLGDPPASIDAQPL